MVFAVNDNSGAARVSWSCAIAASASLLHGGLAGGGVSWARAVDAAAKLAKAATEPSRTAFLARMVRATPLLATASSPGARWPAPEAAS